jgi:hypothetical protein
VDYVLDSPPHLSHLLRMKKPTPEVRQRIEKLIFSLDHTIENIEHLVHDQNLIEWAENVDQEKADQEDLDFAHSVLEVVDRLCL